MSLHHIDETRVTRLIVRSFAEDFVADTHLDVAVVGAGPSGITAARLLADAGYQVAVFERSLYVGGGMWGGGMLFPRIVIQDEAVHIVKEVGVNVQAAGEGYCVADSVECVLKCAAAAVDAGVSIWVGMLVEDVLIDEDARVCGVVLNWGAVQRAQMHVDPLAISARLVIDATGHEADVLHTIQRKVAGAQFDTPTGQIAGESSMNATEAEGHIVELTKEVYPGVIVAGMAANAAAGAPRMGAIFGGMFLSGQRAAQLAADQLAGE